MQKDFEGQRIRPQSFSDRIIFMSMFNDIDLDKKGNEDSCKINSRKIKMYASRFIDRHWRFLGPGEKSQWYQGYAVNCGKWILRASPIVEEFEIRGVSLLGRGTLKMRSGRNTIHLSGEFYYIDFLFRTVHAANQICIYGAVTMLCEKQPEADSGKTSKGRPELLEEHRKKFRSSRKNASRWLIFRDYRLLRETEYFRTWKMSNRCPSWAKLNLFEQRQNSTIQSR